MLLGISAVHALVAFFGKLLGPAARRYCVEDVQGLGLGLSQEIQIY